MQARVLILLDTSLSVGRGNLAICRETIRYLSETADEETELSLAVFGEEKQVLCGFGEDRETLRERLYEIELIEADTSLTDVLAEIVSEWRRADAASHAIILFTDGEETESVRYMPEELYYLLAVSDYPVYVVDCVTNPERSVKNLSAISTISRGELFYTEFQDSEAEVERKLGDRILQALSERLHSRGAFWETAEPEAAEGEAGTEETETGTGETGPAVAEGKTFEAAVTEVILQKAGAENEPEAALGALTLKEAEKKTSREITEWGTFVFLAVLLLLTAVFFVRLKQKRKRRRIKRRRTGQRKAQADRCSGNSYKRYDQSESREEETTLCLKEEEVFRSGQTLLLFTGNSDQTEQAADLSCY